MQRFAAMIHRRTGKSGMQRDGALAAFRLRRSGGGPSVNSKRSGRQLNHDRIATGLDSRPGLSHEGLGQQAPPRSLPYDLGADTSIEFKRDGMLFSMNMPVRPEKPADPVK
jgi:hypothetical protein